MSARLFRWEKMGRQMIARVGPLTVSIKVRGAAAFGDRVWSVHEVFGVVHHGERRDFENVDDAIAVAEALALRLFEEADVALGHSPADSPRKAQAEALREVAADHRNAAIIAWARRHCGDESEAQWHEKYADKREAEADALWPRKGARS